MFGIVMIRTRWTSLRRLQARIPFSVIISFACLSFLLILFVNIVADYDDGSKQRPRSQSHSHSHGQQRNCKMTFKTAMCGPKPPDNVTYKNWTVVDNGDIGAQFNQLHVLIKSIALMSKWDQNDDPLTNDCTEFIIFSDSKTRFNELESLLNQDESWGRVYRHLVRLTYMPVKYPPGFEDLYTMCRPCATNRLFLPLLLPNLTSVLYLDTDTLLLTNPKKIWKEFDTFSEKTWAGMAIAGYTVDNNHFKEFHGKWGLGSGVILLNLTRMRKSQFLSQIRSTINKFWKVIRGDQDILNIYFHYHPEEVKLLNCSQNLYYALCYKAYECTMDQEIEILHGVSHTFLANGEPFLVGIFQCFKGTNLSDINSTTHLHNKLTDCVDKMRRTNNSTCNQFLSTKNVIHVNAN